MAPELNDYIISSESSQIVYKTIGDVNLKLHVFLPEGHQQGDKKPGIVFFFGGGWVGGSPTQFYPHCDYLTSRGMVAISAEYRVKNTHGTTPIESLKDAKSAVRWIRKHAAELGIDPDKLATGGGSAGGHLAAACGTTATIEEPDEGDISCIPNAMVLYNPVLDTSPEGWGNEKLKEQGIAFSPYHHINNQTPPAIIFLGTEDHIIPVSMAQNFQNKMQENDIDCQLCLYEGQGHGFFNYKKEGNIYFNKTVVEMDKFLAGLGYISGKPTMQVPE